MVRFLSLVNFFDLILLISFIIGLLWFWFSDYIPRLFPILSFIYFLGNITPPKALLFRFRFFSKESNLDHPQVTLHDSNSLSQSIASTLYEEEYSMNQITPALREFFMSEAAAMKQPSIDSEGGAGSFLGGTNTAGGGTGGRTSSLDTGGFTFNRNSSKEKTPPSLSPAPSSPNGNGSAGRTVSTPLRQNGLPSVSPYAAQQRKSAPSVSSNPMHDQLLTNPVGDDQSVINEVSVASGSQKGTQVSSLTSHSEYQLHQDNQSTASFPRQRTETDDHSSFWG